MPEPVLIPVDPAPERGDADRVNVFVHGYRSMAADADIEAAKARVRRVAAPGENYLLRWMAGRWADSATVAGLRAAYKATRIRYALAPMSLLVDAGVVGAHEAAQFKRMEWRAAEVGDRLPAMLATVAAGRPVNLVGHSLGARVVHHALASAGGSNVEIDDAVLLAGAADLDADNWTECVARLRGRLYNAYSPRDRVLRITPDLRRRVGSRPMRPVLEDGRAKVVNVDCDGVGHVQHWTQLAERLPRVWPACHTPG